MSKYTPGPWRLINLEPKGYGDPEYVSKEVECADGRIVASVVHDSFDEHLANANLIAAAPDLLEALEWSVSLMAELIVRADAHGRSIEQIEKDGMIPAQFYRARISIARARGEA